MHIYMFYVIHEYTKADDYTHVVPSGWISKTATCARMQFSSSSEAGYLQHVHDNREHNPLHFWCETL